jgi:polysaccharide biosynthesis transport protein
MDIDIFELPGVLRRRWIYPATASLACGVLALAFALYQTPLYRASAELIVDPASLQDPATMALGVPGQDQGQGLLSTASQVYVMQSAEVLSEVVDKLKLQDDVWLAPPKAGGRMARIFGFGKQLTENQRKQEALEALRDDIMVLRADQSLVFSITMKHPSAPMAAEIANSTADAYLSLLGDGRSGSARRASMSFQAQAAELRTRLQKSQNELETFKAEHGLFSTSTKGLLADQEIENLNQQIAAANTKLESQRTIYEQAARLSMADVQAGAIPEALQSTGLTGLRTRYAQLQDTEAQLAANLGANHPQLKAARSQTASMRSSIEGELRRIRESLKNTYFRSKADLAALQARYDELTKATGESGNERTRLAQLQSDTQALETLYQSYLAKAENLGGKQVMDPGSSRIISAAVPPAKPSGAPKILILIAGLLFGLVLGAVLAVLAEIFNGPRGGGLQKVQDNSGIPVVARLQAPDNGTTQFAAQFSGLLGNLFKPRGPGSPVVHARRDLGISRIVDLVSSAFAASGDKEARVMFFPAKGLHQDQFSLSDVAEALAATGAIVHFSNGDAAMIAQPVLVRRGPRVMLLPGSQTNSADWGGGRLHFEPLSTNVPLLGDISVSPVYYLMDASGAAAQATLPSLLEDADAILTIASSSTPKSELQDLKDGLSDWREKLLGMIVIGA